MSVKAPTFPLTRVHCSKQNQILVYISVACIVNKCICSIITMDGHRESADDRPVIQMPLLAWVRERESKRLKDMHRDRDTDGSIGIDRHRDSR